MFEKLKTLFIKEAKIVAGDHSILLTVIIAPLLYAFFLGSVYLMKDEAKVKFGVVDMDKTETSRTLIRLLSANEKIDLINEADDFGKATERVFALETNGFLFIPHNFEKNLKRMKGADIPLFLNTTKFLPSNDINKAVTKTFLTAGAGIRLRYYQAKKGMTSEEAFTQIMPLKPDVRMLYNPTANYGDFLLPGLFLLILHQTLLIGLGESVVISKSKERLKKWFEQSDGNVHKMIFGKSLFYIVLFVSTAIFFFSVIFRVFDIQFAGEPFAIGVLTFLFIVSVINYAFFFASFFNTQTGLMEVFAFTTYPIFLTTGYSWPLQALPPLFRALADFIPLTPYFRAMLKLTQMNAETTYVLPDIFHLALLAIFSYLLAYGKIYQLIKSLKLGSA